MPYSVARPLSLVGGPTKGEGTNKGQCAQLAQALRPDIGVVVHWTRGAQVKGNLSLVPGTVIAIFDSNGRYLGQKHHSHAGGVAHTALYVGQNARGIRIVNQYANKDTIREDFVFWGGGAPGVSGTGLSPEDRGDNYFVVEKG